MIALALEFSSDRRSVAVGRGDEVLAEVLHEGTVRTPVFALIARALEQAGVSRDEIRRLVVGIGPGSYTGIRIAISAVQGWHLASGAETSAVNSIDNLAFGVGPRALLAVDAQRGEFASAWAEGGQRIEPVRLRSAEEFQVLLATGSRIISPDSARLLPGAEPGFPSAGNALRLAARNEAVPASALAPVYLRAASFVKAPAGRVIPGITDGTAEQFTDSPANPVG